MIKRSKKVKAEVALIFSIIIASLFPVLTVISHSSALPPLATIAACYLVSFIFFALRLTKQKKWKKNLVKVSALKDVIIGSIIVSVIVQFLFFISLRYTSPQNYSLLGLTEVAFSFFIVGFITKKEPVSKNHVIGAMLMLLSAAMLFFKDFTSFNLGDLFILLAVIIAPIGNIFTKKALHKVSLPYLLFVRSGIAFVIFTVMAVFFEGPVSSGAIIESLPYVIFSGLVYFSIRKMIFLYACKKISVNHAVSFNSLKPIFVFILAWLLLGQEPTLLQLLTIIPSFIGLHILSKAKQKKTNYGFEESFTI